MARGVPAQDALVRTPLWSTMIKASLRGNGLCNPKLEDRNAAGQLALALNDYLANQGWQWQEDIQAWADCHHGIERSNTKPIKSPETRHSHSSYALQANSAATNSRPKWHPMGGGLVPQ
ncbi:hypothetical protein O181_041671 [Austropuccinia psidii MF-1]|uniref:Uncharacterized protein n=1 Tax=Austropuccinia psidii MF-1 TaxID=1389203 RepID=A0A9Q3HEF8_9BASI|nr:hypothetical protein [Austropuccinia psidii MF-1]